MKWQEELRTIQSENFDAEMNNYLNESKTSLKTSVNLLDESELTILKLDEKESRFKKSKT